MEEKKLFSLIVGSKDLFYISRDGDIVLKGEKIGENVEVAN